MSAALPRSIERGPVEAEKRSRVLLESISLPRSIERGPVEARVTRWRPLAWCPFRAQLSAAPLKPGHPRNSTVSRKTLPRSIERGPVEALLDDGAEYVGHAPFRAQLSAAPLKLGHGDADSDGNSPFRAQLGAAPLKLHDHAVRIGSDIRPSALNWARPR